MSRSKIFVSLILPLVLLLTQPNLDQAAEQASPASQFFTKPNFFDPTKTCQGDCAFTLYAGEYLQTSLENVFGVKPYVPAGRWTWAESQLIAGAASRKLIERPGKWEIDGEIGAGKRFGELKAAEIWAALYFRWTLFPWNDWVKTSVAISTGINYASSRDLIEVIRNTNGGRGANLLHFFSPEVTFALPQYPDWDLVLRFHHRSGGRQFLLGPKISGTFFTNASGGAQYGTVGLRHHF